MRLVMLEPSFVIEINNICYHTKQGKWSVSICLMHVNPHGDIICKHCYINTFRTQYVVGRAFIFDL
jgi:hypothetical protein